MRSQFWTQFQAAASEYKNGRFLECSNRLTRAIPMLEKYDEDQRIMAGVLKARALQQATEATCDDYEIAATCAKSALSRLWANHGTTHKGAAAIARLTASIHSSIATHYDLVAGVAQADWLCDPELEEAMDGYPEIGDADIANFKADIAANVDEDGNPIKKYLPNRLPPPAAARLQQIKERKNGTPHTGTGTTRRKSAKGQDSAG